MEKTRATQAPPCRVVLLTSGKGGVGRSTLTRGLLVGAATRDIPVLGIDFDPQQTVWKWGVKRGKTCESLTEFVPVEVVAAELSSWRGIETRLKGRRLAVIDTPPTVENDMPAILGLATRADLVLVPTSPNPDDLDSVLPWLRTLIEHKARAVAVMNKVNTRTKSFSKARSRLLAIGPVAPVEIPLAEDIAAHSAHGLTVLDIRKSRGADAFADLWTYVAREIGL